MTTQTQVVAGNRDFDFLHGLWKGRNRRLAKRLAGSSEWLEFDAVIECRPILGGFGNTEEFRTEFWPGFAGFALRLFDPASDKWSIYWLDNRNHVGVVQVPVVGEFRDGVGVFEAREMFEGRPIVVRFTWTAVNPDAPRWEQAFSPDDGRTWEPNWISDFTRADVRP